MTAGFIPGLETPAPRTEGGGLGTEQRDRFCPHEYDFPFQAAIALALKLGNKTLYTDSVNMTGEAALNTWRGLAPQNGQPYEYAVQSLRLYAQPQLSASEIAELAATTDHIQWLKKAATFRRQGELREFILGGRL